MVSIHLGRRIALERYAPSVRDRIREYTKTEMSLRYGDGWAFVFSFGSVVFLNMRPPRELLEQLSTYVEGDPGPRPSDDFWLEYSPDVAERVEFERVVVSQMTHPKVMLIARVLAQSTSLERFELLVDDQLERAAAITDSLAKEGKVPRASRDMLRFIGVGMSTRRQIVSQLSLIDPPEDIWEDSSLDNLYHALRAHFELQVRFRSLEYKLELIEEAVQVVVDLHDSRRGYILELIVVVLIAVEVVLAFMGHR